MSHTHPAVLVALGLAVQTMAGSFTLHFWRWSHTHDSAIGLAATAVGFWVATAIAAALVRLAFVNQGGQT